MEMNLGNIQRPVCPPEHRAACHGWGTAMLQGNFGDGGRGVPYLARAQAPGFSAGGLQETIAYPWRSLLPLRMPRAPGGKAKVNEVIEKKIYMRVKVK